MTKRLKKQRRYSQHERQRVSQFVRAQLTDTIKEHGPITKHNINSTIKRLTGAILNFVYNSNDKTIRRALKKYETTKCPECDTGLVSLKIIPEYPAKLNNITFTVNNALIAICDTCQHEIVSAKEIRRWEYILKTQQQISRRNKMIHNTKWIPSEQDIESLIPIVGNRDKAIECLRAIEKGRRNNERTKEISSSKEWTHKDDKGEIL